MTTRPDWTPTRGHGSWSARVTGVGAIDDVLDEAVGLGGRVDPVLRRSGGPAGNARLTAWTGLVLLALIVGELVTLLDVIGLMSWHLGLGLAITAFTLLKVGSTAWRFAGYYLGRPADRRAGPPPVVLRLLGPALIASTLGVLGSGIALIAVGPDRSRSSAVSVLGSRADLVTLHQGFFVLFAVTAGVHVLARLLPAVGLATASGRRRVDRWAGRAADRPAEHVPAGRARTVVLVLTAVAAAVSIVLVLPAGSGWHLEHRPDGPGHGAPAGTGHPDG